MQYSDWRTHRVEQSTHGPEHSGVIGWSAYGTERSKSGVFIDWSAHRLGSWSTWTGVLPGQSTYKMEHSHGGALMVQNAYKVSQGGPCTG